eukprot:GHVQ01006235.1.p1 GENE.GHVQ01006235.1~~GHVQ01006235.1.p1  ORF type:complete len:693 (+),score=125.90 GHVQ01006235.1:1170-3248(+)
MGIHRQQRLRSCSSSSDHAAVDDGAVEVREVITPARYRDSIGSPQHATSKRRGGARAVGRRKKSSFSGTADCVVAEGVRAREGVRRKKGAAWGSEGQSVRGRKPGGSIGGSPASKAVASRLSIARSSSSLSVTYARGSGRAYNCGSGGNRSITTRGKTARPQQIHLHGDSPTTKSHNRLSPKVGGRHSSMAVSRCYTRSANLSSSANRFSSFMACKLSPKPRKTITPPPASLSFVGSVSSHPIQSSNTTCTLSPHSVADVPLHSTAASSPAVPCSQTKPPSEVFGLSSRFLQARTRGGKQTAMRRPTVVPDTGGGVGGKTSCVHTERVAGTEGIGGVGGKKGIRGGVKGLGGGEEGAVNDSKLSLGEGARKRCKGVKAMRDTQDNRRRAFNRRSRVQRDDFGEPVFSVKYKGSDVVLSEDRLQATGHKGWCSVLVTHGVDRGQWYFEAKICEAVDGIKFVGWGGGQGGLGGLNSGGHVDGIGGSGSVTESIVYGEDKWRRGVGGTVVQDGEEISKGGGEVIGDGRCVKGSVRIGWSCRYGRYDTPTGHNKYSYAIRDRDGAVFTNGKGLCYAQRALLVGDIVGCYITLPPPKSFLPDPRIKPELHPFLEAGMLCNPDKPPDEVPSIHSVIEFSVNGVRFGPAFTDINTGVYHPAVATYMGGQVQVNMGPHFMYPPAGGGFRPANEMPRPVFA